MGSDSPDDREGGGHEPLPRLTFGGRRPSAAERDLARSPRPADREEQDLQGLLERCRAKSEAARLAAMCRRSPQAPPAPPTEPDLAAWMSQMVDCSCWLDAEGPQPLGIELLDDVAGCFSAVVEALKLVEAAEQRPGRLEAALPLLAEAQSALRDALARLGAPEDPDQVAAYEGVRQLAARHRVFLKRYMRADDRADPSRWPELLRRIEDRAGSEADDRRRIARFERLERLQQALLSGPDDPGRWPPFLSALEDLVDAGVSPSDRRIRGLILPLLDDLPAQESIPPAVGLVLREIDRFLASASPSPVPERTASPTPEVSTVRRLLEHRSIALIGGQRRPQAQDALASAFRLDELVWIETREHQAVSTFEPAIARPDVALVLLAIRWSSHAFGDVKQICDRLGKPLVRLPGGYHPNQVASQILSQSEHRLRGSPGV